MPLSPTGPLWAKTGPDGAWLTLERHMLDTLATARLVWSRFTPQHVRDLLTGLERPYLFLAAVHDVGKCSPAFQGLPSGPTPLPGLTAPAHHSLVSRFALEQAGLPEDYARVVGAHHGFAPDWTMLDDMADGLAADQDGGPEWQARREVLIRMCADKSGVDLDNLPPLGGTPNLVLLQGLVAVADWIASDLPLSETGEPAESSDKRVARWWVEHGLPEPWRPDPDPTFEGVFGFAPRPFQSAALDTAHRTAATDVMFLEAPMGEGKTEAAMLAAQTLAARFHMGGVYYALPTSATAAAMLPRMRRWLGGEPVRVCHAGAVQPEDLPGWLRRANVGMLTPCCVGTIDQLLAIGARAKQSAMRHVAVAGKVVILDEIHACDAYMGAYLDQMMEWLGAYRVPVIACSATLTDTLRRRLYRAWHRGAGDGLELPAMGPAPTRIAATGLKVEPAPTGRTASISVHRAPRGDVADTCRALFAAGHRRLCVVRDTVGRAVADYEKLREAFPGMPVLLDHGRFARPDRAAHDKAVVGAFGQGGVERGVCVATQVVEQSLDLDFDAMVSDAAPMDLMLQRAGRIHRHDRGDRPQGELLVAAPREARVIYGDWPVERALKLLPAELRLPDDIAPLTERAWTPGRSVECMEWLEKCGEERRKACAGRCLEPDADFDDWLGERKDRPQVRDIDGGIGLILVEGEWRGDIALLKGRLKGIDVEELPVDSTRPWMRVLDLATMPEAYSHELGWRGIRKESPPRARGRVAVRRQLR